MSCSYLCYKLFFNIFLLSTTFLDMWTFLRKRKDVTCLCFYIILYMNTKKGDGLIKGIKINILVKKKYIYSHCTYTYNDV